MACPVSEAYVTRVGAGPFPTELLYPENGGEGGMPSTAVAVL
ncbi:MAG: hypothetical protein ACLTQI_08695 [Slackia sp.]